MKRNCMTAIVLAMALSGCVMLPPPHPFLSPPHAQREPMVPSDHRGPPLPFADGCQDQRP